MEPLVFEFSVGATPTHAFEVWTAKPSVWWPRTHTVTKDPDLEVVFEPFAGGRVFERAPDGTEHDWGEVLQWDPPTRITYLWHLFFDRSEATLIEVSFQPAADGTQVRITQTGFDRLGEPSGSERRTNTDRAWSTIIPIYRDAL